MSDSINQPGEHDAVLGNKKVNTFGAVLGGIQGVKHRLTSEVVEHRITALDEALKYEHEGLNCVIKALNDPDELVRVHAYELLKKIEALEINIILDTFRQKYYLVHFDGVYQREKYNGCYGYIRFYVDGTVITVGSTGNPEQISKWFNKESENQYLGRGSYTVNDKIIKFSSNSACGIIDYSGEIDVEKKAIFIEWHSHINGRSGNDEYYFVKLSS